MADTTTKINWRGAAEIGGLAVAVLVLGALAIAEVVKTGSIGQQTQISLFTIVGILIARAVKGAQDRSAAVQNIDAATKQTASVIDELRGVLQTHGAASATSLQLVQALSTVMQAAVTPPPSAPAAVAIATAPPAPAPPPK